MKGKERKVNFDEIHRTLINKGDYELGSKTKLGG